MYVTMNAWLKLVVTVGLITTVIARQISSLEHSIATYTCIYVYLYTIHSSTDEETGYDEMTLHKITKVSSQLVLPNFQQLAIGQVEKISYVASTAAQLYKRTQVAKYYLILEKLWLPINKSVR